MDAEVPRIPFTERTTLQVEEPTHKNTPRLKPTRVCVILVVVALTLVIILFHHFHHSSPIRRKPTRSGGHVSILMDERSPYNVTITSDLDILQTIDSGGSRVEISVRELLENRSSGPVRITRSNGEEYDVHLNYEQRPPRHPRLTKLEDIKPSSLNVFFIETRCGTTEQMKKYASYSGVVMNARQICSVESTAKLNPSRPIYILHTCPLDDDFYQKSPRFVQELMSYPNVHMVYLDMEEFFLRTNVEELYFGGRFEESRHPIEHVSDVVRLLTLWKYGGTYMDIDVVSIRPLDGLGSNYAGWQDERTIASGVLNFDPAGFGHQILTECLDDLRFNFDPREWSTNGPILITNTLMRLCNIDKGNAQCSEFTAYPIPVFYPLYYTEWKAFFEESMAKRTLNRLNETYVVHIWNKMSSKGVVRVGSGQAYGILADKYCPKTYWNCGPTF
ncbi:lactosylceramide 4-alpha-galactosyltransferase-like [Macrosteles quadrilineatus]|uniref:lactosylceramide 4-alpha-galactosyltransferase-like n=1 Tax=Macrosteles quadrilineatus TaxID=74068 RepID=UPI0023E09022|nr:lactosylceramide 4-alpha-galactosyltransferase-like [Macrosteles quadrilineatus]